MDHVEEMFEWDEDKNQKVLDEHGIDFYTARQIWSGFYLPVVLKEKYRWIHPDGTVTMEKRRIAIGRIQGEVWTAFYTMRHGRIRLITCRPAKDYERSRYDRGLNNQ